MSVGNHYKNNLLFTIWVMFSNISWIYFSFFSIQNIKSSFCIVSSQIFSNHLFLRERFFLLFYIYLQKVQFLLFFADLFWFLHYSMRLLWRTENICYFFINGNYCCFFVSYPIRRIYIWSNAFQIYFMTFIIQ